jgi:hypothetical protein
LKAPSHDDVTVQDGTGRRHGIQAWSAEERAAIDIYDQASARCR